MPLLTSAPISALAIEMLRRTLVLPATVVRVANGEYAGRSGGTVTIAVPAPRAAREQVTPGAEITLDALDETPVDVTLRHFYDAAPVTDEDLTLTLVDFGRQVLRPQVAAVAEAAEERIADAMNGLTADPTVEWAASPDPDADLATLLAIRERMTTSGIPAGDRYLAVSPSIATRLLSVPTLVRAGDRGSVDALEQAVIGDVYGLRVVESAAIATGTAVAYHSTGFGFGNPAPAPPAGNANVDATVQNEQGLGLRHVLAFDARHLQTISVVSTFAGATAVEDEDGDVTRAIKVATA
jgi:hypothetical protein